jgi:hypothetical protein
MISQSPGATRCAYLPAKLDPGGLTNADGTEQRPLLTA